MCETARSARNLGLGKGRVAEAIIDDIKSYLAKGASPRREMVHVTANNYGVSQIITIANFKPDYDTFAQILGMLSDIKKPTVPGETSTSPSVAISTASPMDSDLPSLPDNTFDGLEPSLINSTFPDSLPDDFSNISPPSVSTETANVDSSVSGNDSVAGVVQQVVSTLTANECSNLDFPESLDIENQSEVQKAVLRVAISGFKQREKQMKYLENYLNVVKDKLFA